MQVARTLHATRCDSGMTLLSNAASGLGTMVGYGGVAAMLQSDWPRPGGTESFNEAVMNIGSALLAVSNQFDQELVRRTGPKADAAVRAEATTVAAGAYPTRERPLAHAEVVPYNRSGAGASHPALPHGTRCALGLCHKPQVSFVLVLVFVPLLLCDVLDTHVLTRLLPHSHACCRFL